ncbi:arginine transport ATP-binding protein ArtM [Chlamydia ibidis]|uniref:Arginine transport ATP-binding protein ArtM n=2 Tax=Chlamydia ibidis TaxID=1405396 RepID=S7J5N1_9CHLA|nr:ATP-binding cassette domain-containing protein [Chlamydia ibidis]EPP35543.1 arginine transport ATP-binding protein ArtM [Chlamydia ibidis]EQM62622.1 arginine transport ATP-binding protein ArtM [Chlamydia ibidis 10-1398/6]
MTVRVEHLTYSIKDREVLSDISFILEEGRITFFLGKSGSGKTTIFRSLAGLIKPSYGEIIIKGESPALVFQQPELFPHMTVLGNCVHPQMIVQGKSKEEALDQTHTLLQMLEIESLFDRYPHELSGGQKQRVAIARALCLNKRTILFDEPTSALDPFSTSAFEKLLESLKERKLTLAISTHDMYFIKRCLDKVYLVENGSIIGSYDSENGELERDHPLYAYFDKCTPNI